MASSPRARCTPSASAPAPHPDRVEERRPGALVATLAPDIVLRAEAESEFLHLRGAREIAQRAIAFSFRAEFARPALINGAAGLVVATEDEPIAVMAFTVVNDKIAELDIYADPTRLAAFNPTHFDVP